jgi:NAD(P)H-hydrate epimerase
MRAVLTASEMREADRRTIEDVGLPGPVLMENAGAAVVEAIRARHPGLRRPLVVCGRGKNGGDGFVIARRLLASSPLVVLVGSRDEVKGEARLHMEALERSGGRIVEAVDGAGWDSVRAFAPEIDLVVDALLGTGLRHQPAGPAARAIAEMIALRRAKGVPVVAVDIPSGLSADDGEVSWEAVEADVTVAFAAPKYGHVLPPACDRVGELIVADIGVPPSAIAQAAPRLWLIEDDDVRRAYPRREPGAHKGRFGHVLVVAGSVGKSGAAVLAGTGALVSGAGLVTVAAPAPVVPVIASARAELMTAALPATGAGSLARDAVDAAVALAAARDAVVLGPGLGQEAATRDFVREFLRRCPVPLVLDADGLNALAPAAGGADSGAVQALRREGATVVTPHPGEMARLIGATIGDVQRRRLETARGFALETGAVVVLKGHRTVVARADGRAAVNPTGNPGMATGGTGDVLSGVLGSLLARGADPWTAAVAATYLHGAAGDEAASRRGQEALVAGDLLDGVGAVLRALLAEHRTPEERRHS